MATIITTNVYNETLVTLTIAIVKLMMLEITQITWRYKTLDQSLSVIITRHTWHNLHGYTISKKHMHLAIYS